jgi:hypothetical protein
LRYVLLHELGHALSVQSGEFQVTATGQFDLTRLGPFAAHSWRKMRTESRFLDAGARSGRAAAVVPISLGLFEWGTLLEAIDGGADRLVPGFGMRASPPPRARAGTMCDLVDRLPEAGFVTPTAARYATEDYAVMFTHALLADEGTIRRDSRIELDWGCPKTSIASPYFAPGVESKRKYMTRVLRLPRRANGEVD